MENLNKITRSLAFGLTHPDVIALQKFLNSDPATIITKSGAGSPGKETDYFGKLTEQAVKKFQHIMGLAEDGVFGPKCLEKAKAKKITFTFPKEIAKFQLKPIVARKAMDLIDKCKHQNIIIEITEGFRTLKRQADLYAQGRTAPGIIVTDARAGTSNHNYGVAFDICFVVDGKRVYKGPWKTVGAIGKSVGLSWGGDWKKPDQPHFEYLAGYQTTDFILNRVDQKVFL